MFKSKVKWAALGGLVLSFLSLLAHLLLAKYSNADLVQYSAMTAFNEDLNLGVTGRQVMLATSSFYIYNAYSFLLNSSLPLYLCVFMPIWYFFPSSNWCRVLCLENCGKRWSLWSPCSHMRSLEADILVICCSQPCSPVDVCIEVETWIVF